MASGTLFNASFDKVIRKESIGNFQRQLAEKKQYLKDAKKEQHKAMALMKVEMQKISTAERELQTLVKAFNTGKTEKENKQLQTKKEKYERYIQTGQQLLAPYTKRLEKLAKDIQTLEDEVHALEQSAA
ncbi:MAG: hypothetical protein Q8M03_07625 [Legionella sp.]|nr:hypothetical protein [Legionella sp.]